MVFGLAWRPSGAARWSRRDVRVAARSSPPDGPSEIASRMARAAKPQGQTLPEQSQLLLGRLTRSADFKALRRGQKFEGEFGRMRAIARPPGATSRCGLRIGLIVPRKLGNAPQRNRIKRRLREGIRRARIAGESRSGKLCANGADIGIFPSGAVLTMKFEALAIEVEAGLNALMRKLDRLPI